MTTHIDELYYILEEEFLQVEIDNDEECKCKYFDKVVLDILKNCKYAFNKYFIEKEDTIQEYLNIILRHIFYGFSCKIHNNFNYKYYIDLILSFHKDYENYREQLLILGEKFYKKLNY